MTFILGFSNVPRIRDNCISVAGYPLAGSDSETSPDVRVLDEDDSENVPVPVPVSEPTPFSFWTESKALLVLCEIEIEVCTGRRKDRSDSIVFCGDSDETTPLL